MRRFQFTAVCLSFFVSTMSSAFAGEDAAARGLALARKVDTINSGFVGEQSAVVLKLINAQGGVSERKLALEVLENVSDGDKSRLTFEWPADVRGTRLLTWEHKTAEDDRWLYLPSVKRIKRIASSGKSGSFMGSEFSYEDMGDEEVEKYRYRLLEDAKHEGRDLWRLERVPLDKESGYARQILWLDKEYYGPLRIEYFDRKNELLKVAKLGGYRKLGRHWRAHTIEMENVKTKKRSILSWTKRQLGVKVAAEKFDSSRLEQ